MPPLNKHGQKTRGRLSPYWAAIRSASVPQVRGGCEINLAVRYKMLTLDVENHSRTASDTGTENIVDDPATHRTTNTIQNNLQNRQPTSQDLPVQSASHIDTGTTRAGLPRRRILWDMDMNITVIKTYFTATCVERDRTGYRQEMYRLFIQHYSHLLQLTEQNLADRRSAIMKKNLLPIQIIEQLRENAESDLLQRERNDNPENRTSQTGDVAQNNEQHNEVAENIIEPARINTININNNEEITTLTEQLMQEYTTAKIMYEHLEPATRPRIPTQKHTQKFNHLTKTFNEYVLPQMLPQIQTWEDLITTIYCSAIAIVKSNGGRIANSNPDNNRRPKRTTMAPKWQLTIQGKIEELRKEIGRLVQFKEGGISTRRSMNKVHRILQKHKTHSQYDRTNETIEEVLDTVKQKLNIYTSRLQSYNKSQKRKTDNREFSGNQRSFYRKVGHSEDYNISAQIDQKSVEEYWEGIWSDEMKHNGEAMWIKTIQGKTAQISRMNKHGLQIEEFKQVMKKLQNWKHPGPDGIQNFWLKQLTSLHETMRLFINGFITNPRSIPNQLCQGISFLKAKVPNTRNPADLRPITCLNSMYKLLTSCIARLINEHCTINKILHEQQKGCKRGNFGCKEQLVIDSIILKHIGKQKKNMHAAFIDYRKAFDKVPHSWLTEVLEIYKIDPHIVTCLKILSRMWETTLQLKIEDKIIRTRKIKIKRGIYQGDALSPLWFCLAMNPLSTLLDETNYGIELRSNSGEKYVMTHNLYMDDLKIYATTKEKLRKMLRVTELFSNDIRMEFGINKCKIQSIIRGTHTVTVGEGVRTESHELIQPLRQGEVYKYLGVAQTIQIDHTKTKEALQKEFGRRLKALCKTGLNSKNLTKAVNAYAIPVLTYSFGIIKWSETDLEKLDRKVRTTMTAHKYHHPKSAIQRINISRKEGGRGFVNIHNLHNKQVGRLKTYFTNRRRDSILHRAISEMDEDYTPLSLIYQDQLPYIKSQNELTHEWITKPLHGKYPTAVKRDFIDEVQTHSWLQEGRLFPETEGFMVAIQDEVIATKNYRKHIIKDNTITNDQCRKCKQDHETIEHIINGCLTLTQSRYKERHDNMGKIIHCNMANKLNLVSQVTPYYKYTPETILENNQWKIYWDRSIYMDNNRIPNNGTVHNRPDMLIIDKTNKTAVILDFAVPSTRNLEKTHQEKTEKYKDLASQIKDGRRIKTIKIVPVIMSSTGVVPKSTVKAIEQLGLHKHLLKVMQRAIIISTCSIVREFLNISED